MSASRKGRIATLPAASLIAAVLLAALSGRATAQQVFDACYVEKTGVLYLIDPTGTVPGNLPTTCIKTGKHIQFRWVDGEGPVPTISHGDPLRGRRVSRPCREGQWTHGKLEAGPGRVRAVIVT